MYSKIEEALFFMIKSYKGQKDRINNIDKSFHPIAVSMLIRDITNYEDVIIAAILLNTINDTEYGYEDIEEQFGTLVADIVSDLSEDMSIAKWLDRKKDFIKRIRNNNDINVINIMVADKLQSLLSLYDSFIKHGDKVWKNTGGNKDENCWLYRESYNIAKAKGANKALLERYKELIILFFGDFDD